MKEKRKEVYFLTVEQAEAIATGHEKEESWDLWTEDWSYLGKDEGFTSEQKKEKTGRAS